MTGLNRTNMILAANWKMNMLTAEASALAGAVGKNAGDLKKTEAWIAPPFTALASCRDAVGKTPVLLGGQNVHWSENGAFTGEISAAMLKDLGCSFALTGHSERRTLFGEDNDMILRRTLGALRQGLKVIFCIGETRTEREAGQTGAVLENQLAPLFSEAAQEYAALYETSLVIAYEPVWAIGTGLVAELQEIDTAHRHIQSFWQNQGKTACPPILYGGSVSPENFEGIAGIESVRGALVGGASLSADKFSALIRIAENRG